MKIHFERLLMAVLFFGVFLSFNTQQASAALSTSPELNAGVQAYQRGDYAEANAMFIQVKQKYPYEHTPYRLQALAVDKLGRSLINNNTDPFGNVSADSVQVAEFYFLEGVKLMRQAIDIAQRNGISRREITFMHIELANMFEVWGHLETATRIVQLLIEQHYNPKFKPLETKYAEFLVYDYFLNQRGFNYGGSSRTPSDLQVVLEELGLNNEYLDATARWRDTGYNPEYTSHKSPVLVFYYTVLVMDQYGIDRIDTSRFPSLIEGLRQQMAGRIINEKFYIEAVRLLENMASLKHRQ